MTEQSRLSRKLSICPLARLGGNWGVCPAIPVLLPILFV